MKKAIYTEKAPKPLAKYSQAIKVGKWIYISGQVAIDPETGNISPQNIKIQTRVVLNNLREILKESGGNLEDIVKINVYLSSRDLYKEFNEVYNEYFKGIVPPARTTVVASPPRDDLLIEIDAIAYID
jgi:2-iminobutanoate/2-iminopropanoate deaminase